MEARRIDNNTYDIFLGNGWVDHIRVRQNRRGVYQLKGQRKSKEFLEHLDTILDPRMPITPGQSVYEMLNNIKAINNV